MEAYKIINDFNTYSVSNLGNIKNNDTGRILKANKSKIGYLYISLYKANKEYKLSIHRLVAVYFVDNSNNYPEVNHIDEDKTNCKADNLEWCTHLKNMNHGSIKRRHINKQVKVSQFSLDDIFIREFDSCKEAELYFNKSSSNIITCCKGKAKTAYGYKWRYSGK